MEMQYKANNDGTLSLDINRQLYDQLNSYAHALTKKIGLSTDMVQSMAEKLVKVGRKGNLYLDDFFNAGKSIAENKHILEAQGMDYSLNQLVNEEIDSVYQARKSKIKRGILTGVATAGFILGGAVAAEGINNPDCTSNSDLLSCWEYGVNGDQLQGNGMLAFQNTSPYTWTVFDWTVEDLMTVTAPIGWDWNYDDNTDLLTLSGQFDYLNPGENISVMFTFDPADKILAEGDVEYCDTNVCGTLNNVGTVTTTVVPEPVSALLFGIGAGTLAGVRNRKKLVNLVKKKENIF